MRRLPTESHIPTQILVLGLGGGEIERQESFRTFIYLKGKELFNSQQHIKDVLNAAARLLTINILAE